MRFLVYLPLDTCNRIHSEIHGGAVGGKAVPVAEHGLQQVGILLVSPGVQSCALGRRCAQGAAATSPCSGPQRCLRALRTSRAPARPTTHTSCAPRVQEATTGSSDSPAQRRGQNSPARSDSPTELSQAPSVTELAQVPAGGDESQASPRTRVKGRAAHSPSTAQTPPQSRPAAQRPAAQPAAALDLAEEALLQELFGRS